MTRELILPARLDNGSRWVACPHCQGLHQQVHHARDLLPGAPPIPPPPCPHDDSLARRLGARVVIIDDVHDDAELLGIADMFGLLFAGWRVVDSDGRWSHVVIGGSHTTAAALTIQVGLDGLARLQFRRLAARC